MEAYSPELRCKYKFQEEFAKTYEAAYKIELEWKQSHDEEEAEVFRVLDLMKKEDMEKLYKSDLYWPGLISVMHTGKRDVELSQKHMKGQRMFGVIDPSVIGDGPKLRYFIESSNGMILIRSARAYNVERVMFNPREDKEAEKYGLMLCPSCDALVTGDKDTFCPKCGCGIKGI